MADETKEIRVTVVGESNGYTRKMVEAARATDKLEGSTGTLGKVSKKASKELDDLAESGEGVKRVLQGMGGPLGESGEKVSNFTGGIKALIGTIGAAPLALGALTAGILAVGAAGFSSAAHAKELLDELDELGRTEVLTTEQRQQVESTDESMQELSASVKELSLVFSTEFSPALQLAVDGLDATADALISTKRFYDDYLAVFNRSGLRAFADINEAIGEQERALFQLVEAEDQVLISVKRREREAPPDRARARQIDQAAKATEKLAAITRQLNTSQLSGEELLFAQFEARIDQIDELATKSGDFAAANEARAAATEVLEAGITEVRRQAAQEEQAAREAELQAYADGIAERERMEAEAFAERSRLRKEELAAALEATEQERQARQGAQDAILDNTRTVNEAIVGIASQGSEKQKQIARAAFQANKALAIIQNVIYGANAFTAALDDAPVPFNFVLAGSVAAVAAGQTALIAAQSPSFHTGTRAADEAVITRREVLTPQGAQSLAGDLAPDMNAGRTQPAPANIIVIGHQGVDTVSAEAYRSPSSAMRRAIQNGEPVGHAVRGRR